MNNLSSNYLLKSIRWLNLESNSNTDDIYDVLVTNGRIELIKKKIDKSKFDKQKTRIFQCDGLIMCPGIIDMRVNINDSSIENLKKIQMVAAKSGILSLITLPNLKPSLDNPATIEHLYENSKKINLVDIFAYGAATLNLDGHKIAELGLMSEIGSLGFSNGVNCIQDSLVMRRVMSYASMLNKPVIQHAEDQFLAGLTDSSNTTIRGEMNESEMSTRLGLVGIPACAEVIIIERDIRLAKLTNVHYHVSHVSTKESIDVIKKAKADGVKISCDTSPPYFYLNEHELSSYNTSYKLSPPLRSENDRLAVLEAICDGTIDTITSDHQSHSNDTKILPFSSASTGASGLETLLPLSLNLVNQGYISLKNVLKCVISNPKKILNLESHMISIGSDASFIIISLSKSQIIKQHNLEIGPTPFHGIPVQGTNIATFIKGNLIYEDEDFKDLEYV